MMGFLWRVFFRLNNKAGKLPIIRAIWSKCLYMIEAYIIQKNGLFDGEFYLLQREDIRKNVKNPLKHFLYFGWREGVSPCCIFDTAYYQKRYPDVYYNPLMHYLMYGSRERRKPHPIFNADYFAIKYKKQLIKGENFLIAFLRLGKAAVAYPNLVFPYQVIVEGTIIRDSDLICLKDNPRLLNQISEQLKFGKLGKAIQLYMDEYNKTTHADAMYICRKSYQIESLRDNAESILEWDHVDRIKNKIGFHKEFSYPEVYIKRLSCAAVVGGTNLIIQDNILLNDEIRFYGNPDYGIKPWNNLEIVTYNGPGIMGYLTNVNYKRQNRIQRGILISCVHDNNYFHWMDESLPMVLFALENYNLFDGYPLLIPKRLHKNFREILDRLLADKHIEIITLSQNQLYYVEDLVVPSGFSRILDHYHGDIIYGVDYVLSPLYIYKIREKLRRTASIKKKRKLYLTRHSGTYRRLLNESEIETYLLKYGFEIVDLAGFSVAAQQELFSQAELVIAPTGATMTNMILAPSGCKFVVLYSDHKQLQPQISWGIKVSLWDQLAEICGIDLCQINGRRAYNREDLHDDFYLPIELLEETLKNIMGDNLYE